MSLAHSAPPPAVFRSTDELQQLIRPHHLGRNLPRDKPVPTNAWWGNLLAWSGQNESDAIFAGAYTHRVAADGISVSNLHQYRTDGPPNDNGGIRFYFYPPTLKNWVFSAVELAGAPSSAFSIEHWDDLGVGLALRPNQHAALQTYLTLGAAFATFTYTQLTPVLRSEHAVISVNGAPSSAGQRFRGCKFVVGLNNGHTWVVYFFANGSHADVELECSGNALTMTSPFSGVVQAAYVSSTAEPAAHGDGAVLQLYDSAAGVYPAGMQVDPQGHDKFAFRWLLTRAAPTPREFLHLALTHLTEMMDQSCGAVSHPELALFAHTRGPLRAFTVPAPPTPTSNVHWAFQVPTSSSASISRCLSFYPPHSELSHDEVAHWRIAEIVKDEIHGDWQLPHEGSYYFKGKLLQKWGSMVLVAKKLAETTNPELKPVVAVGIAKLQMTMSNFVANQSAFPLVYDTVYKGIITSEAIHKHDMNVDFGNAVYNDHHYHYGYAVTAAAIVLHVSDDAWRQSNAAVQIRTFVDTLVRDVMCADTGEQFFPRFRHFDWFLGHSYSHGVTPMADGKDEESTSEEVNFFYGLALYSRVTQNSEMENLATLMLNVYARAVNTYFLLSDGNAIHPSTFARNKVTGVFFDNKCDYTTWFSPNKECIHGIQMLPVSPIMEAVRSARFVREEWEQVLSKLDMVRDWRAHASGWTSILFANYSVLDKRAAGEVLATCPMDDGLSRAWALYFAATRPSPSW